MVDVACFAATAAPPTVRMTSTLSRMNSTAISENRSLRPSAQRYSIATVRPSVQPSSPSLRTKAADQRFQAEGVRCTQKPDGGQLARLLRARRERPRRRATEQRHELATFDRWNHSITSSARNTSEGGTSKPIAFAACRLIVNSNLVGCST